MLIAIAVMLLLLAVLGGIVVHPLLFLIAIMAVLLLVSGRRGHGRRDSVYRSASRRGPRPARHRWAGLILAAHRGDERMVAQLLRGRPSCRGLAKCRRTFELTATCGLFDWRD